MSDKRIIYQNIQNVLWIRSNNSIYKLLFRTRWMSWVCRRKTPAKTTVKTSVRHHIKNIKTFYRCLRNAFQSHLILNLINNHSVLNSIYAWMILLAFFFLLETSRSFRSQFWAYSSFFTILNKYSSLPQIRFYKVKNEDTKM